MFFEFSLLNKMFENVSMNTLGNNKYYLFNMGLRFFLENNYCVIRLK